MAAVQTRKQETGQAHSAIRQSWRPDRKTVGPVRRLFKRMMATAVGLALVGWLFYLLLSPFWHPNAYLVVLAEPAYRPNSGLPLPMARRDLTQIREMNDRFALLPWQEEIGATQLASSADILKLLRDLEDHDFESSDALVVFIRAKGFMLDGEPVIKCRDFDVASPKEGVFPFSEFVRRLADLRPANKILLCDFSDLDYDPRLGQITRPLFADVSESKARVAEHGDVDLKEGQRADVTVNEVIQSTKNPGLWMLISHGAQEQSQQAPALDSSLFYFWLRRGLTGWADLDKNYSIDLGELAEYVRENVERSSSVRSDQTSVQSPRLVWGGGPDINIGYPELISTRGFKWGDDQSIADVAVLLSADRNSTTDKSSNDDGTASGAAVEASFESGLLSDARDITFQKVNRFTGSIGSALGFGNTTVLPEASDEAAEVDVVDQPDREPDDATSDKTNADSQDATEPPTDDGEAPVATADTADGAENGAAGSNAESETASTASKSSAFDLVADGWELLKKIDVGAIQRPSDIAPHLWRKLIGELFWHERYLLESPSRATEPALSELQRLIFALKMFADGKNVTESIHPVVGQLSKLIANSRTSGRFANTMSGVADFVNDDEMSLAEWLKTHSRDRSDADYTSRLIFQLADLSDVPSDLARQAIRTRVRAESLAREHDCVTGSLYDKLLSADALRRKGERLLFDRTRSDWQIYARRILNDADQRYRQIDNEVAAINSAKRLRNDVLFSLPSYLELRISTSQDPNVDLMTYTELSDAIVNLRDLRSAIETRDAAAIGTAVRELTPFRNRLREDPLRVVEQAVQQSIPNLTTLATLSRSLAVPFLSRLRTNIELPRLDREAWKRFDESTSIRPPRLSDRRFDRLNQFVDEQTSLESMLLRYLSVGLHLPQEFDGLAAIEVMGADTERDAADPTGSRYRDCDLLARCYDELPAAIRRTYQSTRDLQGVEQTRAEKTLTLQRCLTAFHWIDARDVDRVDQETLLSLVDQADRFDLQRLQYNRLVQEQNDIRPVDREFVESEMDELRYLPNAAAAVPIIDVGDSPVLSIDGPSNASLESVRERVIQLQLSSSVQGSEPVWIVIDYDDAILDIDAIDQSPLNRWTLVNQIRTALSEAEQNERWTKAQQEPLQAVENTVQELRQANSYPVNPRLAEYKPTLVLDEGRSKVVSFRVARRLKVGPPTKLIVSLISASQYLRHEIHIDLPKPPTIGFAIAGPSEMSTLIDDGIVLHPLPNRLSRFAPVLDHRFPHAAIYDLTLLVPTTSLPPIMPLGAVNRRRAADIMKSIGDVRVVARRAVILPPETQMPLMGLLAGLVGSPKTDTDKVVSVTPAEGDNSPPTPFDSHFGLVLRVDDQATGESVFRRIAIAAQRPSRFLQPTISFDVVTRRLTLEIAATAPEIIPREGIRVVARVQANGAANAATLTGVVVAPGYKLRLSSFVPSSSSWADITIDVDDYPRAFNYSIPCSQSLTKFERQKDLFEVRLTSPSARQQFKAPTNTIPAEIQVDAPIGSFPFQSTDGDYIEVGLDIDRDREFRDEEPIRLKADRAIEIFSTVDAEFLAVTASVGDFKLSVPTGRLQGLRANLLARMVSGQRQVWSEPVEVVLDGEGPVILKVELAPDRMVRIGKSLQVRVSADDGNLSGVGGMDFAVDQDFTGMMPEKAIQGKFVDGMWTAKIPFAKLKPGLYDLLVLATDNVGNKSDIKRVAVHVLEASSDPDADIANIVSGRITYDEVPLAKARVTLTIIPDEDEQKNPKKMKKPKPSPKPVLVDVDGQFVFDAVPPGRYMLKVAGLARNKPRFSEKQIVVRPRPGRATRVNINIRY
jgi:hypothetical protein